MKSVNNKTVINEWLSVTMGVVAALAVLCSQSFTYTSSIKAQQDTKKEVPSDHDQENHDIATVSQDAVSSFVQLTISHDLHFITDIYHNVVEEVNIEFDQKIDFNSFFKTLFRLIISPNAP